MSGRGKPPSARGAPRGGVLPHYATASLSSATSHAEPRSRQSGHRGLNGPAQCRDQRSTLFPSVGSGSPPKGGLSERSPRAFANILGSVDWLQRRCSGPRWLLGLSSSCPESHGSSGAIGFPHRQHVALPAFTSTAYRLRSFLWRVPYRCWPALVRELLIGQGRDEVIGGR
jgi:hypothetical protein